MHCHQVQFNRLFGTFLREIRVAYFINNNHWFTFDLSHFQDADLAEPRECENEKAQRNLRERTHGKNKKGRDQNEDKAQQSEHIWEGI